MGSVDSINLEKYAEAHPTLVKMKNLVSEQLGIPTGEVTLTSNFIEDLGADSLDVVEMVMAVEEEFEVELPDEEMEEVKTVQDAVALIDKKLAARKAQ